MCTCLCIQRVIFRNTGPVVKILSYTISEYLIGYIFTRTKSWVKELFLDKKNLFSARRKSNVTCGGIQIQSAIGGVFLFTFNFSTITYLKLLSIQITLIYPCQSNRENRPSSCRYIRHVLIYILSLEPNRLQREIIAMDYMKHTSNLANQD